MEFFKFSRAGPCRLANHNIDFILYLFLIMQFMLTGVGVDGAGLRPRAAYVNLGAVFTINDVWLQSENGAFQLEVRQWVTTTTGISECMAGVRYTYKTPTALIWSFNTEQPLPWNATNCILELTMDGVFRANVTLDNGTTIIPWQTNTSGLGVQNLTLQNDGNLVLLDSFGSIHWQSFGSFTDLMMIPSGMKFFRNNTLYERKMPDYSEFTIPNRFALRIGLKQDLVLFTIDNQFVYYTFGPSNPTSSNELDYIIITENITFYDNKSSVLGWIEHNNSVVVPKNLIGSGLFKEDGNFMINYLNFTTTKHSWYYNTSMSNFCNYPVICGDYGICNSTTWTCSCPLGFEKKPGSNNTCLPSDPAYSLHPINVAVHYQLNNFLVTSQDQCRDMCAQNTSCNAALFDTNTSSCSHFPIFHTIPASDDNSTGQILFIKVQIPAEGSKSLPIAAIVSSTVAGFIILSFLVAFFIWHKRYRDKLPEVDENFLQELSRLPPRFTYKDLQAATKEFSKKLGVGGFSTVYEGKLLVAGTETKVAIKKLEQGTSSEQSTEQFKAEVATIGSVSHMNLVKLLGFCIDGDSRMLLYEFMARGSLDRWLFKKSPYDYSSVSNNALSQASTSSTNKNPQKNEVFSDEDNMFLTWELRCKIALHTARALEYLHHQCTEHIVHCDVKPQNILLDVKFNAKVADFGLAKLLGTEKEGFTMTTLKGTRGYLAPEWLQGTSITTKSDVYSYGVVLLELITGKRCLGAEYGYLPVWAMKMAQEAGNQSSSSDRDALITELQASVLDPDLLETFVPHNTFECMFSLALACVQNDPVDRPTMASVVQTLENSLGVSSQSTDVSIQSLLSSPIPSAREPSVSEFKHSLYSSIETSGASSSTAAWLKQPAAPSR